jgi:hypothetical protein
MNRDQLQDLFEKKAPMIPRTERFAGTYRWKPTVGSNSISTMDMWDLKTYIGKWEGFLLAMDVAAEHVSPPVVRQVVLHDTELLYQCRRAIKESSAALLHAGLLERLKLAMNTVTAVPPTETMFSFIEKIAKDAHLARGADWYEEKGHNWFIPREIMIYLSALKPELIMQLVAEARMAPGPLDPGRVARQLIGVQPMNHCTAHVDYDPSSRIPGGAQ